jgi:hypothetical protein
MSYGGLSYFIHQPLSLSAADVFSVSFVDGIFLGVCLIVGAGLTRDILQPNFRR